jgi:L-seryl-tRNA(Ser) seleniumtransferase
MKRRQAIKNLSILPVTGVALGSSLTLGTAMTSCSSPKPKRDLFKELGLKTFINAAGTYTDISASIMHEETLEAIQFTSQQYAAINDVQDAVGKKIAELCHAESAMVTAGCFSALILGTAACITGTDRRNLSMLPNNLEGLKSEIISQRTHNSGYVHACRLTGAKIIEVETAEDVRKAINSKTAMMWFLNASEPRGQIKAKEWADLGNEYGVPTLIDMAADSTPVENLWKFNDMGFSLVCVSGGKGLRGPQSAGILMGKKDLIAAARLNAPPNGNNIGRGMKVNKEEIIGMYVALEKFINSDHKAIWKMWEDRIAVMENAVKAVDGVTANVTVPEIANITPTLSISWDQEKIKVNGNEMRIRLRQGDPSIEMMGGRDNLIITAWMMKDGDAEIVASRMVEELKKAMA